MEKLDVLWNAGLILHREVDPPQVISASEISCQVVNNDGPVQLTDVQMEDNAIRYVAEVIGEDPADLEVFSLTWVGMPYVDASELPPPAP
jgi:hypothetical protein